ncbi:pyridoxal phosphate-dependent aminotransferase [Aureimonas sp. ME7]|uniref:pyridoxal phosphate-dependent aminotransferase n=1 Tax=Aureimonas sp. ME7 TaxID=2744252 RepID=UPI0015FC1E2D|nr:pyridoxal phosphate-dependent aminotransferase [Aureimonas sp. ME7]
MTFENSRAAAVKSSPSMAVSMAAKRLIQEGRDIVDLSLGEPDFEPPAHVSDAACAAIRAGGLRYGVPAGNEPLRRAIAAKFSRDNGLSFGLDEIVVGNGAKQLLFDAFLATLEKGDEVVIPTPCWVSYGDIVTLNGGTPVYVECPAASGFKLTAAQLEAAITPRTRWLMLNSPSNPTGAVMTRTEYEALGAVLAKHPNILVLSDEIYEHILLADQPFVSFGEACPALRERTLIVNGVSKAYAMTGWRVGYAAGPKGLIAAMAKMQSQSVTSVSAPAQAAALAALDGDQSPVGEGVALFRRRAALVANRLGTIPGIDFAPPPGAFYAFIGISGLLGRRSPAGAQIVDDTAFARVLLEEFGVSSIPGIAFGAPGHIRFSIAASDAQLEKACDRLEAMVRALA